MPVPAREPGPHPLSQLRGPSDRQHRCARQVECQPAPAAGHAGSGLEGPRKDHLLSKVGLPLGSHMNTQAFSLLRGHESERGGLPHFPNSNKKPKKVNGERKVLLTFRTRTTGYPYGVRIITSHHTQKKI